MLWVNFGIAPMRQFHCVPKTYVTENEENYFEVYTYHVACTLSLPLLNISKFQFVRKYLSLIPQIVYIYMTAISPNLIS